jgi:hypothetical protein
MGEVVPRSGTGSLVKIAVREFRQGRLRRCWMSQRVKCVHVYTCGRRRVRESLLCPSACFCEDPLQLKRVTFDELPGSKDRRERRQGGEVTIFVSRRGDQAWRLVGQ